MTGGYARNDHELSFSVFPDDLEAFPGQDLDLDALEDIPCSPEDTARWQR